LHISFPVSEFVCLISGPEFVFLISGPAFVYLISGPEFVYLISGPEFVYLISGLRICSQKVHILTNFFQITHKTEEKKLEHVLLQYMWELCHSPSFGAGAGTVGVWCGSATLI
jgi:hypothetical protein